MMNNISEAETKPKVGTVTWEISFRMGVEGEIATIVLKIYCDTPMANKLSYAGMLVNSPYLQGSWWYTCKVVTYTTKDLGIYFEDDSFLEAFADEARTKYIRQANKILTYNRPKLNSSEPAFVS